MKYAFLILCLSLFIAHSNEAHARSITSFRQSDAITAVATFMYDVGEDIPVSPRMTDKKLNLNDVSNCASVTSHEVISDIDSAIRKVSRYYPDEDVPYEQALVDMEDYLDYQSYKKCVLTEKKKGAVVTSSYYVNADDMIHLRLDNIALTSE